MKKNIHPKYFTDAKIICACGNIISTGSTRPEMKVEVCSACHPFYTGKKRLVDTAGRLDRFKKRMEKSEQIVANRLKAGAQKKKSVASAAKTAPKEAAAAKKAVKAKSAKKPATAKKTAKAKK